MDSEMTKGEDGTTKESTGFRHICPFGSACSFRCGRLLICNSAIFRYIICEIKVWCFLYQFKLPNFILALVFIW